MTAQPEGNDTPDMTPEERAEYLAEFYPDGDVIDLRDEISAAKKGIQSATEGGRHDDVEKFEGRRLGREQQLKDLLSERRMHGLALVPETAPTPAPAAPVVAGSAPDLDHCPPTPQAEDEANGTFNEAPEPVPAAPPEAVLMPQPSPLDTPLPELTPTPQPEPAQPLPPSPAVPVVAESWHLKKPERAHGYTWELYSVLKAARDAGKTCPKPREVLDSWQAIKPPNITEVMSNEFKYLDSSGEIKTADLKALRKAIDRMRSAR